MNELENEITLADVLTVKNKKTLTMIVQRLRVLSANGETNEINDMIDASFKKSIYFNDQISLIRLYDLQIRQFYNSFDNLPKIDTLLSEMKILSDSLDFKEGQTLVYQIRWHVEKLRGNYKKSRNAILSAMHVIKQESIYDEYTIYGCKYSYAVELWLSDHNPQSANLLEDCLLFFFREGYYRSLVQSFSLLSVIYTRTHDSKKILKISNKFFADRFLFTKIPLDVKGILYYFTGLGYMMNANLEIAESYFKDAYNILKPLLKTTIYFAYVPLLNAHITNIQSLQGKTEQAKNIIRENDTLLQTDLIKKNLDPHSKKQITHTHNLAKFYTLSRLHDYSSKENQKLIEMVFDDCKDLYSDFMTMSEFILNSNLTSDKLQKLLMFDNYSINRVKHLIRFELEKQKSETSHEQKALNCINILKTRKITNKTTFIEHAYADILIAQQLFYLKKFAEIAPLLKKYETRLNQIEVLELRIFMEAFIQVGKYKNGDPLGPALQYMAIKKCRVYGFSKLENKLIDYLQLQHNDILRNIN